jgi:hypothetical protein
MLYSRYNIGGLFLNGTIAYTNINTGNSLGTEQEEALFLKVDRPLVSPFSHLAGGAEISINRSMNVYKMADSTFLNYQYNIYDSWAGYNIGTVTKDLSRSYSKGRNRTFLSARMAVRQFSTLPDRYSSRFDPVYNNRAMILGQYTLFRQDFYKLNYIYGFGVTEDIPTGYNINITAGFHRQLSIERPYVGLSGESYLVTPNGGFLRSAIRLGTFYYRGVLEDASTLLSLSLFTKLMRIREGFTREYLKFSFTQLHHRTTTEPLYLNNAFGLRDFTSDSTYGDNRLSAYAESVLYTPYKVFGFRIAPFLYAQSSVISKFGNTLKKADVYTGLGGGIRIRNENLIFGTIQFRAIYFPRPVDGVTSFRLDLVSDLRYRFRTLFVTAPDIVQLNSDFYE